jgi:hypothetical protein
MEPGKGGPVGKIKGRVETQPRFKIQYPMKNHYKDGGIIAKRCILIQKSLPISKNTQLKKENPAKCRVRS